MEPIDRNVKLWRAVLAGLPPFASARVERAIRMSNPPPFCDFVAGALEKSAATGKPWSLSHLRMDSAMVVHAISVPELCPLDGALRMARAASRLDDRLDCKLLDHLATSSPGWPLAVPETKIVNALEVIDEISDCSRIMLPLMTLAKLPQPRLRSKAIKLMARGSRNPRRAKLLLADADPRTRANLIEGLGAQTTDQITALLREAAQDTNHRVAVTALLGLCRAGDEDSCEEIRKLACDGDPNFRKAAAWALRQLRETGPEAIKVS
jgi:hypothetical protein